MVVANVGEGAAYDISFDINPDRTLRYEPGDPSQHEFRLSSMSLFSGVRFMPPGYHYRFFFTRIVGDMPDALLTPITIDCRYFNNVEGRTRELFTGTFILDPGIYVHMQHLGRAPEYDIKVEAERQTRHLRAIRTSLERISKYYPESAPVSLQRRLVDDDDDDIDYSYDGQETAIVAQDDRLGEGHRSAILGHNENVPSNIPHRISDPKTKRRVIVRGASRTRPGRPGSRGSIGRRGGPPTGSG